MLPLPRRHAWLAGPPANTCSRNNPQNKRQQRLPQNQKAKAHQYSSRRSSGATAPNDRSRGRPTQRIKPPKTLTPSCRPLLRRHVARKTNPLVPSTPVVARRRMTTPVVNSPLPPPLSGKRNSARPVIPPRRWQPAISQPSARFSPPPNAKAPCRLWLSP